MQGRCPFAADLVAQAQELRDDGVDLLITATCCDQQRRAAEESGCFLFGLPHSFTSPTTWRTYTQELHRLSRILQRCGATAPDDETLRSAMQTAQARRDAYVGHGSARRRIEGLIALRGSAEPPDEPTAASTGLPLALLGGDLHRHEHWLYDAIECAGGRLVLDGTSWGERTLPRPFGRRSLREDPVDELVDAYFGSIADIFRRPNAALFSWLLRQLPASGARALVVVRQTWCDMWAGEVQRLRSVVDVPTIELCLGDGAAAAAIGTRLQALVEQLA